MATRTFTTQEMKQRQALSISRIRDVVETRIWTTKALLIQKIVVGYDCSFEQAQALFEIGLLNGYIEYDEGDEMYKLTEPSSGRRIAAKK